MPTVKDTEQCSPVFAENSCKCRMYRFSRDGVGAVPGTQVKVYDLEYCDKLVGWRLNEYKSVSTYWEQMRVWLISKDLPSTKKR